MGPLPERAVRASTDALSKQQDPSFYPFSEWNAYPDVTRELLSKLLGGSPSSISHHTSVSEVISTISMGFDFREGDEVITFDGDYPSNILPWMLNEKRIDYRFKKLPIHLLYDPKALESEISKNTRIIDFSHVSFNTGRKAPLNELERIFKKNNIFTILDVSQSFGGSQISPDELGGIDVLCGVTYKWLLGPYGHAFARWSDRALGLIHRTQANWLVSPNSQTTSDLLRYTIDSLPGACRFDRGQTPNCVVLSALNASLELLLEIGLKNIEKHNLELAKLFISGVDSSRFDLSGDNTIVVATPKKKSADDLKAYLQSKNIDCSLREGSCRFAFHLFNTETEIQTTVNALNQF